MNNTSRMEFAYTPKIEDEYWAYLPDPIIFEIFSYLSPEHLLKAGETCQNWCRLSYDELLWKRLFFQKYQLKPNTPLAPGKTSWYMEFKRLIHHAPRICSEVLSDHRHEVLHVSFSHDGTMFATSSKDGYIFVWNATYPASIKYSYDMKVFSWKYTQFSQFNVSDTLLLVSGVHFGTPTNTSGEIAVFSLQDGFNLQCRVGNKPYDIFGTWFSDRHLLSGDLNWIEHMVSTTGLWINKASQETDSEHTPILNQLFRFYNVNASSLRVLMVADCISDSETNDEISPKAKQLIPKKKSCLTRKSDEEVQSQEESDNETDDEDDLSLVGPKMLIFTTGSKTYTPHQIGFKKIKNVKFPKVINREPSLRERLRRRERRLADRPLGIFVENVRAFDAYDRIDHVVDMHGHIIGMCISPDQRFLYVNSRPWPAGYTISNPLEPPPIAQEINIHVIDLKTFEEVGPVFKSHKAFTPNDECFFIFLDVSDEYVSSGAEDRHGYLWDRHYGICICKLPHTDVVNSVAFNPANPEMLVTTSDDFEIKVWRSQSFLSQQNHVHKVPIQHRSFRKRDLRNKIMNFY